MKHKIALCLALFFACLSQAQDFEHSAEINDLYKCLFLNGYFMDKEVEAIKSDLNLGDSTKYEYAWIIKKLPMIDSVNDATVVMATDLYKKLYAQEECKFLAEQVFQSITFLNSVSDEYSKQKQLDYLSVFKALDIDQNTEDFLQTSNIRTELLESIVRRKESMKSNGIHEAIKYFERSLILKQCFNP